MKKGIPKFFTWMMLFILPCVLLAQDVGSQLEIIPEAPPEPPPVEQPQAPTPDDTAMSECHTDEPNDLLINRRYFSLHGDLPGLITPAVRVLFQRYMYGLLSGDIKLILSTTSESLDFPYYPKSMDKKAQFEFFSELFATYPITEVKLENIYCLNTGKIILFDGARATLIVRARQIIPEPLKNWHYWESFWGLEHYYFFEKINHQWKIIAFDIAEKESVL